MSKDTGALGIGKSEPLKARLAEYAAGGHETPKPGMLKTEQDVAGIRESGRITTAILDYIGPFVEAGVTTERLDRLVHDKTVELGGIPAPLQYNSFPKSCCISLNEVVCHGVPSRDTVLRKGDILNIDVSTVYRGYFSDASRMYCVQPVPKAKRRLAVTAKECMEIGLRQVKPWGFIGDIGFAVSNHAQKCGCSVVVEMGGHGIGREFHEEPYVCFVSKRNTGMLMVPGMVFTVEPMINLGRREIQVDRGDGWTVRTADGKPSAQWECTVLVTGTGYEILAR